MTCPETRLGGGGRGRDPGRSSCQSGGARPGSKRLRRGYALVAAVLAVPIFSFIAFGFIAHNRGAFAGLAAEEAGARLEAAAEAGLAMAVAGLTRGGATGDWSPDGRVRRITFEGVRLAISVEDERGKLPINRMTDREVERMFAAAGLSGAALRRATDGLLDWRDDDEIRRPMGAEAPDYARRGLRPRQGALLNAEELADIEGVGPSLYARLAPSVSVFSGSMRFDPTYAAPLALDVLGGSGEGTFAAIERSRALAGQRTALELGGAPSLAGRPLTIRVLAIDAEGGRLEQSTIVEFRADRQPPQLRYRS